MPERSRQAALEIESLDCEALLLQAEADRDALLAALEAVEWVFDAFGNNICWWCRAESFGGHADDCQRQAAIAQVKS